jgi:TetR/AcrR family transcriptional repressor of nem operon
VMEATGLEKGGLYRHFGSKEELAVASFRYALGEIYKVRVRPLREVTGAMAKLRRAVELFIEEPSAVAGGCPVLNTALDADDGNPALRTAALQAVQDWRARLVRIVQAGVRDGEIVQGTEPRRVANTMIAALEGALMISRLEKNKTALRDAQGSLEEMFARIDVVG